MENFFGTSDFLVLTAVAPGETGTNPLLFIAKIMVPNLARMCYFSSARPASLLRRTQAVNVSGQLFLSFVVALVARRFVD